MNQGVYSLAATMINQLNRVDVVSNNLANANTNAFKQDNLVEGSFNYYLQKKNINNVNTNKLNIITNTIPKIDERYINSSVGSIEVTANQLDFSLNTNNTFFKIKDNNGQILLTRDGAFKNLNGFLSTSEGYNVLNQDNEKIAIENGFENLISLVKSDFSNLKKQGKNNYISKDNKLTQNILNNDNFLLQGSLEKSNVNAITSMVALIDSQRRLEQAQKASNGIDEINQKLIEKLTR